MNLQNQRRHLQTRYSLVEKSFLDVMFKSFSMKKQTQEASIFFHWKPISDGYFVYVVSMHRTDEWKECRKKKNTEMKEE